MIKETSQKIDYQIQNTVTLKFSEEVESKVRRGEITTIEHLSNEVDTLMTCIQVKYANDIERVEGIYRKHVYNKIFKIFDTILSNEKN